MAMTFDDIEAQPTAVRILRRALEQDRLAHAYLFEGPGGVGKHRAALALTLAANCQEQPGLGCRRCETCRRIEAGTHPDVRFFEPRAQGARNLPVEHVRSEILPLIPFAPFEATTTFLVFPEADVSFPPHHAESANALLKALEEPKPRVCFVLLSERPDRLLPTIRSRCQCVRFARLPDALLHRILADHDAPAEARDAAVALADGRADRALQLAGDGQAQQLLELAWELDSRVKAQQAGPLIDMAEELARGEHLDASLEAVALFYRDLAAVSLGIEADGLRFRAEAEKLKVRAESLGPSEAARRTRIVEQTLHRLERNANPELTLDAMLFELSGAR